MDGIEKCHEVKHYMHKNYKQKEWFVGVAHSREKPGKELVLYVKSDKKHKLGCGLDFFGSIDGIVIKAYAIPPNIYLQWEDEKKWIEKHPKTCYWCGGEF